MEHVHVAIMFFNFLRYVVWALAIIIIFISTDCRINCSRWLVYQVMPPLALPALARTSTTRPRRSCCWTSPGICHITFLHLTEMFLSHMVASLLSTALTMSLVLAVSVFLYGTFYYAYMPEELVNMPVSKLMHGCCCWSSSRSYSSPSSR